MGNSKNDDFQILAFSYFEVLSNQGYFDFDAIYAKNEKSITITTHNGFYEISIRLNTEKDNIWNDDVQLSFLIALEDLSKVKPIVNKSLFNEIIREYESSGFENIKSVLSNNTFTIMADIFNNRIAIKYSYEDISDNIEKRRAFAAEMAIKTGMYKGIDPRYQRKTRGKENIDVKDFDSMYGLEFEKFCATLLSKNGYKNVEVTKGSGDQGLDIMAVRGGTKYGIQCKCYSNDVGNKAVMEVHSGISFYKCDLGVVLSNRYYTRAAKELAKKIGVVLWDRSDLLNFIEKAEQYDRLNSDF